MSLRPSDKDRKDVSDVITMFFEAGKNKDLTSLATFHGPSSQFSKFDENPPYTRQRSDEAFVFEQAMFANITDFSYSIDELRIDLLTDAAIATFYLTYKGMFVNDYSFEGSPVSDRARVTFVLTREPTGWKIIHEHLSRFPDWAGTKPAKPR